MMRQIFQLVSICVIFVFSFSSFASNLRIIRDAETEEALLKLAKPLMVAAKKKSPSFDDDLRFIIVDDSSFNAFVTLGINAIFINSGLIYKFQKPEMIAAVIAHEMGHLIAHHPVSKHLDASDINKNVAVGSILGVALAVFSPAATVAVFSGAAQYGQREFLARSRVNEQTADQIAIDLLLEANYPLSGMFDVMSYFMQNSRGFSGSVSPYLQTHPMSSARLSHVKNSIDSFIGYNSKIPAKIANKINRVVAKLFAYNSAKQGVKSIKFLNQKGFEDQDLKYATAMFYSGIFEYQKAIHCLNQMLDLEPDNPFVHELKAEIYFKGGQIEKSVESYNKAFSFYPSSVNIRLGFAISEIHLREISQSYNIDRAILNLEYVLSKEEGNIIAIDQLAKAYSINGNMIMFYLYRAKSYLLQKDFKSANKIIAKIKKVFKVSDLSVRDREMFWFLEKELEK